MIIYIHIIIILLLIIIIDINIILINKKHIYINNINIICSVLSKLH